MNECKIVIWLTNPLSKNDPPSFYPQSDSSNMETYGWVKVRELTVTDLELPSTQEVVRTVVAHANERIDAIYAKAEKEVQEIKAQLSEFLALEHS